MIRKIVIVIFLLASFLYCSQVCDTSSALDCGHVVTDNPLVTLTIVLNFKANNISDKGLLQIGNVGGTSTCMIYAYSGQLWADFKSGGGSGSCYGAFSDTTSYHSLMCVFNQNGETRLTMYLDGALFADDSSYSASPNCTGKSFVIGEYFGQKGFGIEGDVRIYNRVLTLDEHKIINNSHGNDNITSGLIGRWLINEKSATSNVISAIDVSGYGHNGTPIGTPKYVESTLKVVRRR